MKNYSYYQDAWWVRDSNPVTHYRKLLAAPNYMALLGPFPEPGPEILLAFRRLISDRILFENRSGWHLASSPRAKQLGPDWLPPRVGDEDQRRGANQGPAIPERIQEAFSAHDQKVDYRTSEEWYDSDLCMSADFGETILLEFLASLREDLLPHDIRNAAQEAVAYLRKRGPELRALEKRASHKHLEAVEAVFKTVSAYFPSTS